MRTATGVLLIALFTGLAPAPRLDAQGVQTADAQVLLSEARRYFDALDYDRTVAALDRAIALLSGRPAGDPGRGDLAGAYEMRARSRFGLGDQPGAREDFVSLLKIAPDFKLTADVSPRVVSLFNDALKATVTTFTLAVTPETAEVRIDGMPVSPGSGIAVAVGDHTVAAKQLGYRDITAPLVAEAGKTVELTLTLERISAVLNLVTSPAGVDVLIDGISHGKTAAGPPPQKYADMAAKAGIAAGDVSSVMVVANLAPGSHLVEFKRDCYIGVERRVAIDKPDDYAMDPTRLEHAVASLSVRANQPGAEVYVDGQVRGVAPYTTPDLCEGEHTVELRSISGRYFKRIQARTGDKVDVVGTIKPGFALVAATTGASALNTDLRVVLERAFEPSQAITIFAPASAEVAEAMKAQQLPPGWFAFDGKRRPIGVAADISAPVRQDLSTKLARTFDAQGIASVTVPSALDRNRVVLALLGAGSGQPDVIEVGLDNPDSIRAAIGRIDRNLSFFNPSIGLSAIDVADVAGAVVVGVDANGPAAKAGVLVGDIVTKMNGQPIGDAIALVTALSSHKANDDVTLELKPRTGAPKHADMKVFLTPRLIGMADQTMLANAVLLNLRARLLAQSDPIEESVIRLNVAAALARLEAWSDAKTELQRVKLPDGPGVANGTVQYLLGICAERLGNRAEAETAWKAAAASDSLLTEDGPPVKELAEARLTDLQRRR